jgi:hypothetical protein
MTNPDAYREASGLTKQLSKAKLDMSILSLTNL